ncbi:MAG TPA: hypothetical protein DDW17_00840 [Deltaproteobacteria bacterium]|nr:hypothetical protein [Deltaproteobacteria bacterium]
MTDIKLIRLAFILHIHIYRVAMKKLEEIRKEYILRVLSDTCWDIKKASKILKISEKYLKKEIQKMGYIKNEISNQ